MKWRTLPLPEPKIGEIQSYTKFAWKPTEVEEYIVWLESYTTYEKYTYSGWIEFKRELYFPYYF